MTEVEEPHNQFSYSVNESNSNVKPKYYIRNNNNILPSNTTALVETNQVDVPTTEEAASLPPPALPPTDAGAAGTGGKMEAIAEEQTSDAAGTGGEMEAIAEKQTSDAAALAANQEGEAAATANTAKEQTSTITPNLLSPAPSSTNAVGMSNVSGARTVRNVSNVSGAMNVRNVSLVGNANVVNNDGGGEDSLLNEIFDRLKSVTKRVTAEKAQAIRTKTRIEDSKTFTPTGQVSLDMVNNSRSYYKLSFFGDVKSNSSYKQVKKSNMSEYEISSSVSKIISDFIKKMNIQLDLSGYECKCVLQLHDTIDRISTSEKIGDRCNALNIFVAMIKAIKDYVNSNNSGGNPNADKLFNFPIEVTFSDSMFGSGFRKSYKACNGGSSLYIGGSKSRRRNRCKPARKTRRGRIRKSKSKTHRRRRHSRARKHKKNTYTRRR